ncbi:hypothetical protein ACIBG0_10535 [Nocardia sp. NPDC050630]|uniref:hypothetical protein n=1 Tax=Nocardia sp. NPDC050630 TaxID=3364321 RepID=UPI0037B442B5
MSSVDRWSAPNPVAGDAYVGAGESHRTAPRRGEPGFAEREAVAKWMASNDGRDLSEVLAWVDKTAPIKERDLRAAPTSCDRKADRRRSR